MLDAQTQPAVTLPTANLNDALNWRYATKKMDPAKVVPDEKVAAILEAIRLAPSSSGLQPFEVLVITNPDLRAKLRAAAFDQAQVTDGSHLLVFAAWDNYTEARMDAVFDAMAAARGGMNPTLTAYRDRLKASYLPRDHEVNHNHAARQAYIALGIALTAAAFEQVDSTPMEGFDPAAVDDILGLKAHGLRSVLLMPLGYRDTTGDWLSGLPKVRRSQDDLMTEIA